MGSDNSQDPLDDLGRRIDKARKSQPDDKPAASNPSALGAAFRLSTELVVAVFVGLVMGLGIDWFFGTKPFGLFIFLAFGIAAGFYNVFRTARAMNAKAQEKDGER